MLILNADDWGRDPQTTDRIHDCVKHRTLSSVSAMVFMEDSERSAALARESGIDAGLHLNFTTGFTGSRCPSVLFEHQRRVSKFLSMHNSAQVLFHPGLVPSFDYVVKAQCEEYAELYGVAPERFDGHHHMHLCANVLIQGLLPKGKTVRRHFSFRPGQKSVLNRWYRGFVDRMLARHHLLTDYFFSIVPFDAPGRLRDIFSLAEDSTVEVETHPAVLEEYEFLARGRIFEQLGTAVIANAYNLAAK